MKCKDGRLRSEMRFSCMKRYIYVLAAMALFVACEQKASPSP